MHNEVVNKQMPIIDFEFIHLLEGGVMLDGFVADAENSISGVTIAAGFDLGAKNEADLRLLNINPTLIGKLYPYLGKQGREALVYLNKFPLRISEHEANAIDTGLKMGLICKLINRYNDSSHINFYDIPLCWQTVIASVELQYSNLQGHYPKFWEKITKQQWFAALLDLRNFGDKCSVRRCAEADYIQKHFH